MGSIVRYRIQATHTMVTRVLLTFWLLGYLAMGFSLLGEEDSCKGRCNDSYDSSYSCQCNTACTSHNDCCGDYVEECAQSCRGRCGAGYDHDLPCQCNDQCSEYGNCCPDYDQECSGHDTTTSGPGLSDQDLITLSEMLIAVDHNNVGGKIQLNLQCTTNHGNPEDCSPDPLFTSVNPSVMSMPIYVALSALYDNYVASPGTVEDHTEEEHEEEMALLEMITGPEVLQTTYQFLLNKGVFTGSQEDWQRHLYDTWFGMYDRAPTRTILGSSGFEHVFIGEIKNGAVGGFHNWFHWYYLEMRGELNYLGYWETAEFGENMEDGGGISFTYTWNGVPKPYGSMFLATSPELEMALYATCLMTRPGEKKCHVTLSGTDVYITTWPTNVGDAVMVGSSYPDWK